MSPICSAPWVGLGGVVYRCCGRKKNFIKPEEEVETSAKSVRKERWEKNLSGKICFIVDVLVGEKFGVVSDVFKKLVFLSHCGVSMGLVVYSHCGHVKSAEGWRKSRDPHERSCETQR